MPLTLKGRSVEKSFEREYGHKKGKSVFYAWMHKHPGKSRKFHMHMGMKKKII